MGILKKLIFILFFASSCYADVMYLPRVLWRDAITDIYPYISYDSTNYRVKIATDTQITGDLTVIGDGTFNELTITSPTQNFKLLAGQETGALAWQAQTAGAGPRYAFYTKDGDGTDNIIMDIIAKGTPESHTDLQRLSFGYAAAGFMLIRANTQRLEIRSGTGTTQIVLNTDGSTNLNSTVIIMDDLPTVNPENEGQLWNDGGTLMISGG